VVTEKKKNPVKKNNQTIKTSLMKRYGEIFVAKLTSQDLDELQYYRKKQYDREGGWNSEYRVKFESKLRQYFHEEILTREIASIETLLGLIDHQDLRDPAL
jgi:hypothetical protein